MTRRRPPDPFKNHSEMTAMAILVRSKADRIDAVADELLHMTTNATAKIKLTYVKMKVQEIITIVEGNP